MKILKLLYILTLAVMAVACGDDTEFRVAGEVQGLGTRNISMLYVADGSVRSVSTAAIDGKFDLRGSSDEYTVVELFVGAKGNVPLARMLAKNGETLHCKLDIEDPSKNEIKGNGPSEQWSGFLRENAAVLNDGTPGMINSLVTKYVDSHPDNIVSSLLMLTSYNSVNNESRADSLFAVIAPEARPAKLVDDYRLLLSYNNSAALNAKVRSFTLYSVGDSMERYSPYKSGYSLLYFTDGTQRSDTITRQIKRPYDSYSRKRFRVVEVSFAPDSAAWKRASADSLGWTRVWAPGGVAHNSFDALNIPRIPFYILADSNGTQVYRGSALRQAIDSLDSRIKKRTK